MKPLSIDKSVKYLVIVMLVLLQLVSHAGGLGVVPIVFILGLVGIWLHFKSPEYKVRQSPTFLALIVFFIWLCVTSLWSPYQPDYLLTNYLKFFIIGIVLYFCPMVFKRLSESSVVDATRVFLVTSFVGALMVAIDVGMNFKVTTFIHPPETPQRLGYRLRDAEMNLGHAITLLVLISAPVTILLKNQLRSWKILTIIFFSLIVTASYLNNLSIGILSSIAVLVAMLTAWKYPIVTPKIMLVLWMLAILFAPGLGFVSSRLIEFDLSNIPISWEHRLRMWSYCWHVILENPIIGDGFDAARTYQEQWRARNGVDLTIVSLHPHNAGIHIWTETGIIGALLASAVILSLFKPIKSYAKTSEASALVSGVLTANLLISSMTYGAWQFWWWGCAFFTIGLMHLLPRRGTQENERNMKEYTQR